MTSTRTAAHHVPAVDAEQGDDLRLEHVPACSCGWTGERVTTEDAAQDAAADHIIDVNRLNPTKES